MYKIKTYKKIAFKDTAIRGYTEIFGNYGNIPFYAESIGKNKWSLVYNVYGYSIDDMSSTEETKTTWELFEFLKKCK